MTWIGFYLEHLFAVFIIISLWIIFDFKEKPSGEPSTIWKIAVAVFVISLVYSIYLKDVEGANVLLF